jgi:hypothetical protein
LRGLAFFRRVSPREQDANLFVGRLREIPVPAADCIERFWRNTPQMTSSALALISSQVSGDAVGTATTMRAGFCCRNA